MLHFIFVLFGAGLATIAGLMRFSEHGTILGIKCAELGRIDSIFFIGMIIIVFFIGFYLGKENK